jgi:hypothetical protein
MAEFCNQCAKKLGRPTGDFANLVSWWKHYKGFGAIVLCEGCGLVQVDRRGNFVQSMNTGEANS